MKRKLVMGMVSLVLLASLLGCGASKYKTMYGISDWYYTNHITLEAQYNASTPENQAWLRKNVNPYMNIMRQAVIGMSAFESGDNAKLSQCVTEIIKASTGIQYDTSRIVAAIKLKDYDALLAESLALKTFIVQKLTERR